MKTTRTFAAITSSERLTVIERAARVAVGVGLLSTAAFAQGPLGWVAILPLLAVYPMLTGVIGYEPLRAFLERDSVAYRTAQLTAGAAMVGSVFVTSQFAAVPMELFAIVPLIGVYYVLAGILGRAPLASVDESMRDDAFADERGALVPVKVPVATQRTAARGTRAG
jgi:hypothetical protein